MNKDNLKHFPLELTDDLHICLWSESAEYKWTIAYWVKNKEGYDLQFVGNRPLSERVKWKTFKNLIKKGQKKADKKWKKECYNSHFN